MVRARLMSGSRCLLAKLQLLESTHEKLPATQLDRKQGGRDRREVVLAEEKDDRADLSRRRGLVCAVILRHEGPQQNLIGNRGEERSDRVRCSMEPRSRITRSASVCSIGVSLPDRRLACISENARAA